MKIQTIELQDREELRALLLDAAEELAGPGAGVLEPRLPWDGHPILLVDAEQRPVLVSFDNLNAQASLLSGLNATEMLSTALPWLNRIYEALGEKQLAPKLVVVSRDAPPGSDPVLNQCACLRLFQFRALRVNGETGLLLEPLQATAAAVTPTASAAQPQPRIQPVDPLPSHEQSLPPLSGEEDAYFQQL